MSEREDLLWALERQARSLADVLAEARILWRDANARAAEQKFLQPRAAAESTVLAAVAAQHRELASAAQAGLLAEEKHRQCAAESAEAARNAAASDQSAQAALREASTALAQADQTDHLAAGVRGLIAQATAAGSD